MAVVAPSFDDLLAVGKAEAQLRRPQLGFRDGDVAEAQLHASAAMSDKCIEVAAKLFRDTFFDGAVGDALTALVDDRVDIQRQGGTKAVATLTFNRGSSGAGGTITAGTRFGTDFTPDATQAVFTLDADLIIPSGNNGPFTATATALDAGPEGNVAIGTILKILDPLFDSTFSVINFGAAAGGNLEETDAELRQRAKTFYQTLRRGTLAALEEGALTVSSVRVAHAVEDPGTFEVTLVVSDSDGGSTLEMEALVAAEIESWRCAGVPVNVRGGRKVLVSLALKLAVVREGFDADSAVSTVADLITANINGRKGGETVYLDELIAAAIAVAPGDIRDVSFMQILLDGVPQSTSNDIVPADVTVTFRAGTITIVGPGG